MPGVETEALEEVTVVVPSRTVDDDATVLREVDVSDDATVVRAADVPDDATFVRPHVVEDATTVVRPHVDDETVVHPRDTGAERAPSGWERVPSGAERAGALRGDPAPPIAEPVPSQRPSSAPLRRGPARVYGARAVNASAAVQPDEVLRRIGPAPAAEPRYAAERPPLPSLARRFRRERAVTLICYAGAVVLAAAGLTVIARIAFG